MIQSKLVFSKEYRWDLKKVKSVLIPYLFDNDASLIISVKPQKTKLPQAYDSAGNLDQLLIDYPYKLVASSQQILLFKNYEIYFPQQGRFQLEFFPGEFLGKTQISISRVIGADLNLDLTQIEEKLNQVVDLIGT